MKIKQAFSLNIIDLVKCQYYEIDTGFIIPAYPAVGALFVNKDNPSYITGYVRTRGRDNGKYPYNYLEMLDQIFGYEPNTIEVCSNSVRDAFTVDINPEYNPSCIDDAQVLSNIESNIFDRFRADPPYSERAAKEMYHTSLPDVGKLLKAGARVCKQKALLFLLLGNVNRQACPLGVKRIGHISISVIPNNEMRNLHIYYKLDSCNVLMVPKNLQRNGSSNSQAAGGDVK